MKNKIVEAGALKRGLRRFTPCVPFLLTAMDPTVRSLLPRDAVSFSMPAGRFVEMADHIPGSFLVEENWLSQVDAKR